MQELFSVTMQGCNDLEINDARILTMMQVDVDRFSNIAQQVCDLWASPLQILVTICILYTQVELAFLSGLFVHAITNECLCICTHIASKEKKIWQQRIVVYK